MSFATKLCKIVFEDGSERDVMKTPKTDNEKISMPGELAIFLDERGFPVVHPKKPESENSPDNLLHVIYDHGRPLGDVFDDFDTVRARVHKQWSHSQSEKRRDVLSAELKGKIELTTREILKKANV